MSKSEIEILRSTLADDADMRDLIELFVNDLHLRVDAIHTALESGNLDEVRRISHQLRGASAGFGFAIIGATAAQVEETIKAVDGQADGMMQVRPLVDQLASLCRRVAA